VTVSRTFAPAVAVALAAGLAYAGTSAIAPSSAAADPIAVSATVFANGSKPTTRTVSVQALQQKCPTYNYAATLDGTSFILPPDTWTLASVLGSCGLGLSPQAGDDVVVQRGNGSWEAPLSYPGDVQPSAQNTPVPVILFDGTNIEYFRPQRSASDVNARDQVVGGPIALEIDEGGPPLTVGIAPSPSTEPLHKAVTFAARVVDPNGNAVPGSQLSYSWSIAGGLTFESGGAGTTGSTAAVTFSKSGTYTIGLQVNDSQGSGGSASISITVGTSPGSKGSSGPGNGHKTTHNNGPSGHGSHHASTGSGGAGTGTTTTTTTTTTTPTPTTTVPVSTTSTSQIVPPTTTATTPIPPAHATAPLIVGELVSDLSPLPAQSSPLVHPEPAAATTSPGLRASSGSDAIAIVAASLTIVFLFALGAARELGWRPRWRVPRFGA
jgi:hypothetical protein